MLSCDGDAVLWEAEEPEGGGVEAGEDAVAPLCSLHQSAGFATQAGLFDAFHEQPAVFRAAHITRRALQMRAASSSEPLLLLLAVEDADLLQGDEEEEEEEEKEEKEEGGKGQEFGGRTIATADAAYNGGAVHAAATFSYPTPVSALRALCKWATCHDCWAAAMPPPYAALTPRAEALEPARTQSVFSFPLHQHMLRDSAARGLRHHPPRAWS